MEGLSKKEKGIKATQWLMETTGKKYLHVSREVEAKQKNDKNGQLDVREAGHRQVWVG